jgi:gluconate 2-dehydrogenase gamma chain
MSDRDETRVTRRAMLAATAGAVAAAPMLTPGVEAVVAAVAVRFFTPAELAMVDELTEIVVPADTHSPGAKAAAVAAYIDTRLAESFDQRSHTAWRAGLTAADALSTTLHGKTFMKASAAERLATVTKMAAGEASPKTDAEKFFVVLKAATIPAYYTSKIGIHQDMEYKGNTILQEFVGADVSK